MAIKHFLQFKDFNRDEYEYLFARTQADQGALQGLPAVLAAERPHAGDDLREGKHAHAPVVRGRHAPARRLGDLPEHARLAARARRAGRGRGAGDLAHERHRHDPHLRAGDHRALRRQLARAGDQRADQRIPPVPDPRRHLHLHRASRLRSRARRWPGSATPTTSATPGCRRREVLDFKVHVSTPPGYEVRAGARRRRTARPFRGFRRPDGRRAAAPTW